MTVRMLVRAVGQDRLLAGPRERLRNLTPALRRSVAIRREGIGREFAQEAGVNPGGGLTRWRKTSRFGNVEPPAKTMQRSGAMLRALLGSGRGSVERYTEKQAEFGVDGAAFPQARILRQGGRIRVTDRMRRFLGAVKGVHLRRSTKSIRIPARPYGSPNPATRQRINEAFRDWIVRGVA